MEKVYHIPVLLKESVDALDIKPSGIYVDVTFGGGGHSKEILKRIENGKLIAFDQDKDVEENLINDERFIFVGHNFKFLKNFLKYHHIEKVDGILADLGVSSHHLDSPERGFSFRFNGELDMRMNRNADFTAADLLNTYSKDRLQSIFKEYGEIHNPGKLAETIESYRYKNELKTIFQFTEAIKVCIPKHEPNKFLAQVFQSMRMEVNKEVESLKLLLNQTVETLNLGGRLVCISYHSLEDRLVKNFMRSGKFEGDIEKDLYGNSLTPFEIITKKAITPSESELEQNSRSRSAKLRVAKKV